MGGVMAGVTVRVNPTAMHSRWTPPPRNVFAAEWGLRWPKGKVSHATGQWIGIPGSDWSLSGGTYTGHGYQTEEWDAVPLCGFKRNGSEPRWRNDRPNEQRCPTCESIVEDAERIITGEIDDFYALTAREWGRRDIPILLSALLGAVEA